MLSQCIYDVQANRLIASLLEGNSARDFFARVGRTAVQIYQVNLYEIEGGFRDNIITTKDKKEADKKFVQAAALRIKNGGEWEITLLQKHPRRILAKFNYSNYDGEYVRQLVAGMRPEQAYAEYKERGRAEWRIRAETGRKVKPSSSGPQWNGSIGPQRTPEEVERFKKLYRQKMEAWLETHPPGCRCLYHERPHLLDPLVW